MMPFRHSPTAERLEMVLKKIEGYEELQADQGDLLLRFRRQTTRRLQVMPAACMDVRSAEGLAPGATREGCRAC